MDREKNCLVKVDQGAAGQRLDHFLAGYYASLSRSQIQRLIASGRVMVNSRRVRSSYKMRPGDTVAIQLPPAEETNLIPIPEDIPLEIIFEDQDLLVINKPQGMVVHPAAGHKRGTLVNALLSYCPQLAAVGEHLRPGIVHRLDKDTSGLLLVGKSDLAYRVLRQQLKEHRIQRRYLALVHGRVKEQKGVINAPLGRDPRNRKKRTVLLASAPGAREARTDYHVLERFAEYTLLDVGLETGRTHQIRVHLAYAGYPVAGDQLYGWRRNPLNLPGQALHAFKLSLEHPRTGKTLSFKAPPPPVFANTLKKLRSSAGI